MSDIVEQLKSKESVINDLIQKKSRQDGQKEQLFSQLKTEFNVDSLEAAVDLLDDSQKEVIENEKELIKLDSKMADIIAASENKSL